MTTEERVKQLENKLTLTIELLKFIVRVDNGLTKDNTDWLLEQIETIQRLEG